MESLKRTFIAIDIVPSEILNNTIEDLQNVFSEENFSWVNKNKLHLTLKFIGNTSHSQIKRINEELKPVAEMFKTFTFSLVGIGFFNSKGIPRILFVKIAESEKLKQLVSEIEKRMVAIGFQPESRPFSPHITIARIKFLKNRSVFYKAVDKYEDTLFQTVNINEIVFYESILKAEGAQYIPLNIFKL